MARKPQLEPGWLVGLLNQWALRSSRDKGLGYPTICAMLKDGIPGRVRSYEPTGYGDADFKAIDQAVSELDQMRRLAICRHFRPWSKRMIDAEIDRDTDTWMYHLRQALAELEQRIPRQAEVGSREWLCAM